MTDSSQVEYDSAKSHGAATNVSQGNEGGWDPRQW